MSSERRVTRASPAWRTGRAAERRRVEVVLTDIDDTLTLHGRLPAVAYAALERLAEAGFKVIPITGRPAGWCDHIARMWPVEGVVGENGAFWFRHDRERAAGWSAASWSTRRRAGPTGARLDALAARILAEVPGCRAGLGPALPRGRSRDRLLRGRAARCPTRTVARIVALFEAAGCTAKVSSIHVNGWFGSYDKLTMTRLLMREAFGDRSRRATRPLRLRRRFAQRPADVRLLPGQHRRRQSAPLLRRPRDATALADRAEGGQGFAEVAELLLAARNAGDTAIRLPAS